MNVRHSSVEPDPNVKAPKFVEVDYSGGPSDLEANVIAVLFTIFVIVAGSLWVFR